MATSGRIKKEIEELKRDTLSGVSVIQDPADAGHLTGTIKGPDDTPYAGGTFTVDITIPSDYPFSPPKMKFNTKDQWSPALTMKTALLSLQALMCSPEPRDPQDHEVARMYLDDQERFISTAKFWTESYAMPAGSGATVHPSVQRLMDMGFPEEQCREALLTHKGDENAAVEALLTSL